MSDNPMAGDQEGANQPKLELQKLYLKDVSLETPNSPKIFTEDWQPKFSLQINTETKRIADNVHEVVLTLTITASQGELTGFLIEIQQAGIFLLENFPDERMGPMLGAYCPNMLFPYVREAVDSLLVKGGFPPLQLSPINFDAIYQKHLQAQQERQEGSTLN